MKDTIIAAIEKTKAQINLKTPVKVRTEIFIKELATLGLTAEFSGERPATGRAFGVIEQANRYRVNVRCGYGKYNYAPCVHILKAA